MSINRRSMAGRIYQEQTFRPKQISLNNPEDRKLRYPIKGDTSFQPNQFGRKHLSPKHSAIHSLIFNQNYEALMQEKTEIIKNLTTNKRTSESQNDNKKANQFPPQKKNEIIIEHLNNYLKGYLIKQNKIEKRSNKPILPSNNFDSDSNLDSINDIKKTKLSRQGSMNEVLHPYSQVERSSDKFKSENASVYFSSVQSSFPSLNSKTRLNSQQSFLGFNKDSPRCINPNNLNSFF